jgi:hypothetical protein
MLMIAWSLAFLFALNALLAAVLWIVRAGEK